MFAINRNRTTPPPGRSECPNRTPGHSFFSLVGRKTHARAASWSKAAVLEGSVQCPLWSIDPFVQPRRLVDGVSMARLRNSRVIHVDQERYQLLCCRFRHHLRGEWANVDPLPRHRNRDAVSGKTVSKATLPISRILSNILFSVVALRSPVSVVTLRNLRIAIT